MSGEEAAETLLFDGLELSRRGLIRRDPTGRPLPVALGSRALDLLLLLAKHEGAVVSKRDLIAAVWPGIAVEESNLTKQISALRRALDPTPGNGGCIQTVPGRGYRFVARVRRAHEPASGAPLVAAHQEPSIAVLPFRNLSADPAQDYFAEGMTEEIRTAIARFPRLFVVARSSWLAYQHNVFEPGLSAREPGLRYVLQGSVRTEGNRVRIGAELIDVTTARQIWGDRFDGTGSDMFALHDRVVAAIVGAIEPRLRLAEIARATRKAAGTLNAYDLNMRASAQISKRTKQGFTEAVRLLHRTLNIDPGYAPAMAQLGYSRLMQMTRHWIAPSGSEVNEGIGIARRAIAEAGDDPEVLTAGGHTLGFFLGDFETALAAFDRAIDLNPYYAHAFGQQAMILAWLSRSEEAIAAAQRALHLSPHDPDRFVCWLALAWAHFNDGRCEEALLWTNHALRENTGAPALRLKLSLCGHLGRHDEAKACLRLLREVHAEPTVAAVKCALGQGKSPQLLAHLTDGLREAGLPAR